MSHFVAFHGYGVGGRDVSVAVARVTHLYQVDYNGNYGVEITFDSGKTVTVRGFLQDVEKVLEAAAAAVAKEAA